MTDNIPPANAGNEPPTVPYGAPAAHGAPAPAAAPAPKKKSIFQRWWFWVIIAVVVIAAISSQAGKDDDATPAGGDTSSETSTDAGTGDAPAEDAPAEEAPAAVPGIGEVLTVGDLAITVTAVEAGKASVGQSPLEEKAQGAFTLVTVSVQNNGTSAESVFSNNFVALDDQKREFDASTTASIYLGDAGFVFQEINPGNTASGVLAFDLPADVAATTLQFTAGLFGGDSVEIALQ